MEDSNIKFYERQIAAAKAAGNDDHAQQYESLLAAYKEALQKTKNGVTLND